LSACHFDHTTVNTKMKEKWMSAAEQGYHSRNTKVATCTFNWEQGI